MSKASKIMTLHWMPLSARLVRLLNVAVAIWQGEAAAFRGGLKWRRTKARSQAGARGAALHHSIGEHGAIGDMLASCLHAQLARGRAIGIPTPSPISQCNGVPARGLGAVNSELELTRTRMRMWLSKWRSIERPANTAQCQLDTAQRAAIGLA